MELPADIRALFPGERPALVDCIAAERALTEANHPWPARARVAVLRTCNADNLPTLLRLEGFRRGIDITVDYGDFGTLETDLAAANANTSWAQADALLLAWHIDGVRGIADALRPDADEPTVHAAGDYLMNLVKQAVNASKGAICVPLLLPPTDVVHGDPRVAFNDRWSTRLREAFPPGHGQVVFVDLPAHCRTLGEAALQPRYGMMHTAPFSHLLLLGLARDAVAAVAGNLGLAKKVLVLDCDNTLWGGVVGEVGREGIALNPHDYPGNAYHAFQRQVLALLQRGLVVCLCSKNNEADVRDVFENHAEIVLRMEHIAAYRINWEDKASNLRALADELNLGLDSFVFIDDSPQEIALVEAVLPEVTCLTVPKKAYQLPNLLATYPGFFRPGSGGGLDRTRQYQEEGQRRAASTEALSKTDFLADLGIAITVSPAKPKQLDRVATLIARTNQFNLTTPRYTPAEIANFRERPDALLLVLEGGDRFGSYGLVGVALILHSEEAAATIDTFLMSCRVLGRGIESAFLQLAIARCLDRWRRIDTLHARYLPTRKNGQTADFYDAQGFALAHETASEKSYRLPLGGFVPKVPSHISVSLSDHVPT